ncbi:lipocalin family protein [Flavobacterium sp.]|uniref:lipocalin family protein n=1 Tax=Flavobacterium sp. TaxID=239 RepID=UPI0039E2FAE3
MKKCIALLSFLLLLSCAKPIDPKDLAKLNGYWEIDYVVLPDGEKKDYPINETYDYFEIKGDAGTRTKVMPQLDGKFLTNALSEKVKIVNEKDQTFLEYQTDYTKWREQLLEVTDSVMVLRNKEKNEYHYKKTDPINLDADGKKTR